MKPTVGSVPMDGVFALSRTFDSIGVMAKSAQDVALLTSSILNPDAQQRLFQQGIPTPHTNSWKDLAVGFIDCSVWEAPAMVIICCLANIKTKASNRFTLEARVRVCSFKDPGSWGSCCLST